MVWRVAFMTWWKECDLKWPVIFWIYLDSSIDRNVNTKAKMWVKWSKSPEKGQRRNCMLPEFFLLLLFFFKELFR